MNILIVDDSVVYRTAISEALAGVPEVTVFKTACNGKIAVDIIKQNPGVIDLVTLDMEMPEMDGIATIKAIRQFDKSLPIIVFSGITEAGAEKTLEALNLGANDFVKKIVGRGTLEDSLEMIREELLPKIRAFEKKKIKVPSKKFAEAPTISSSLLDLPNLIKDMVVKPKLICLGCSTGGPGALTSIFSALSEELTVPMLIVQHMPPMFTEKLAIMLDKLSPNKVIEAKEGDVLKAGTCYVAPGDFHMELIKDADDVYKIKLNKNEKVCYVRPSVDVLFSSVAKNYNKKVLAIVLTGMGEDGAVGAVELNNKEDYIIIQNKETSVVWGMPMAVRKRISDVKALSIEEFAPLLNRLSKRI